MDNAGYIALSRQVGLFRQMDVVANNVANANTDGYKAQTMSFRDYQLGTGLPYDNNRNRMDFVQDVTTRDDMSEGAMRVTNRPFDVAISGKGFFEVDTPLGPRFTRLGSFHRDGDGRMVTYEGYPVAAEDGAITIEETDTDIRIYDDGRVTAKGIDGLEEERGQIRVVGFADEKFLSKRGNGLYEALPQAQQQALQGGTDYRVSQGMLEGSNVNPMLETTRMITVNRTVGVTSNFLKQVSDLQSHALDVIAQQP